MNRQKPQALSRVPPLQTWDSRSQWTVWYNGRELTQSHHSHFFYDAKYLGRRTEKIPAHVGKILKKKDLPNNKEILDKERERIQAGASCARHRNLNCPLGDADVIHSTVGKFRNAVYPDLAPCFMVPKTNAVQWALQAALLFRSPGTDLPSDVSLREEILGLQPQDSAREVSPL